MRHLPACHRHYRWYCAYDLGTQLAGGAWGHRPVHESLEGVSCPELLKTVLEAVQVRGRWGMGTESVRVCVCAQHGLRSSCMLRGEGKAGGKHGTVCVTSRPLTYQNPRLMLRPDFSMKPSVP